MIANISLTELDYILLNVVYKNVDKNIITKTKIVPDKIFLPEEPVAIDKTIPDKTIPDKTIIEETIIAIDKTSIIKEFTDTAIIINQDVELNSLLKQGLINIYSNARGNKAIILTEQGKQICRDQQI